MLGVTWNMFLNSASINAYLLQFKRKFLVSSVVCPGVVTCPLSVLWFKGNVEGTRARGRSPMRWTDQVKATIEAPLHECARKATVREEWRSIVKRAAIPR
ncbi:jg26590 [Pararge aegeria aegeria]|uniref:Jg26590 protein n=1 Tax=Pararge aegeria aegeria TaxID=348720 RepID=A0A8S4QSE6_9NEOP|nr:jg26590 [Pararge aegeria aegeria]